jgi:hypothetical protein
MTKTAAGPTPELQPELLTYSVTAYTPGKSDIARLEVVTEVKDPSTHKVLETKTGTRQMKFIVEGAAAALAQAFDLIDQGYLVRIADKNARALDEWEWSALLVVARLS